MKSIKIAIYQASLFAVLLLSFSSCKKFVETQTPPNALDKSLAFSDSLTATSAILGIYAGIASGSQTSSTNSVVYLTATYGAMSADEAYSRSNSDFDPFRYNTLAPGNALLNYWSAIYSRINRTNFAIEGLTGSTISPTLRNQLLGEARFWRGWLYFQLMNYFGDVPLVISSDAVANSQLPRTPKAAVLQQIMTDLTEAKKLLTTQYPSTERARVNKNVVSAFLARVYFYQQKWSDAEAEASAVINSGTYSLVQNLDNVFLNNSNETIWQISLFNTTTPATVFGAQYIPANTASLTFVLYDQLVNTFEANDQRLLKWAKAVTIPEGTGTKTYYYPYKYKQRSATAGNEYPVMLRLSEMYLIRGEALAQQDNFSDARRDLDSVRRRAGLLPTTAAFKPDLLTAFEHERWVELFTESGDRWFNLKRLNKAPAVLKPIKPNWQDYQQLYPIPQASIGTNPALIDNTGYVR